MCFSATASFVAGSGLIALGGASFTVAKKEHRVIAAIPLLFGIQQISEGVQWLYLNHGSTSFVAGYGFLFFVFLVWPIYTPAFIYILDKKNRRKIIWFIFLGILVSLYSLGAPLTQNLTIQKINMCVGYDFINYPYKEFLTIAYLIAVFGPFFVSSKKVFNWFGVVFAFFAIISWYFYQATFLSVWCFFSAIVSFMFFLYIRSEKSIKKIEETAIKKFAK